MRRKGRTGVRGNARGRLPLQKPVLHPVTVPGGTKTKEAILWQILYRSKTRTTSLSSPFATILACRTGGLTADRRRILAGSPPGRPAGTPRFDRKQHLLKTCCFLSSGCEREELHCSGKSSDTSSVQREFSTTGQGAAIGQGCLDGVV